MLGILATVPTWLTPTQVVAQLRTALFTLLADNSDQITESGGNLVITAGVSDYDDLSDKPFLREDPHTTSDEDHLLVWTEGGTPVIFQPHTTQATNPTFRARAFDVSDLPGGSTWGDPVESYIDLPVGVAQEHRFVRDEVRVFKYLPDQFRWIDAHIDIFQTLGGERWFRSKVIAETAVGAHYHNDDDANGVHICYGDPRTLYTITDFTAGAVRETVHKPYGSEVAERVTVNSDRISHVETNILAGKVLWFGTVAEYDALTADQKADDTRVHFRARP